MNNDDSGINFFHQFPLLQQSSSNFNVHMIVRSEKLKILYRFRDLQEVMGASTKHLVTTMFSSPVKYRPAKGELTALNSTEPQQVNLTYVDHNTAWGILSKYGTEEQGRLPPRCSIDHY